VQAGPDLAKVQTGRVDVDVDGQPQRVRETRQQHRRRDPRRVGDEARVGGRAETGLLAAERGGRNRYYRLADERVAAALEALAVISPERPVRSLRDANRAGALSEARTCYGHLAGRLGVSIADALTEQGALVRDGDSFAVGDPAPLRRLGLDSPRGAKPCNDWSERRPHVAGPLGVALAKLLFERGWIERLPQPRAVRVTDAGRRGLHDALGI
jgi:hypothetical protein